MQLTKELLNSGYVESYIEYGHKDVYKQVMDREPLVLDRTIEEVLDQVFAYADRFTNLARFLHEDASDGIWFSIEVILPRSIGWLKIEFGSLAAFTPLMTFLKDGILVVPHRPNGWRLVDWGFDDRKINSAAQKAFEIALENRPHMQ